MSIYDITVKTIKGEEISLSQYENKVLLIVNTASKCGLTPQFEQLQHLYTTYKEQNFVVLGFPCNQFMNQDPGNEEEIEQFCSINYGVSFPMFAKIDVNGEQAHPLYKYLTSNAPGFLGSKAIKWNFTKFLIDRNGKIAHRYSPQTAPSEIEKDIIALL